MATPVPLTNARGRALGLALAVAATLVVLRAAVFVALPWSFFDSDQAIVGLMAKHLSEGRAFPLFFYGQQFLLGVEAWLAVPWFLVLGPTAAALKLSVLATNLAVAALLILGLARGAGMRPMHAVAASAFFLFASPSIAAHLLEAMGGNIEPFLFVTALWWLRRRPLWFGAVLAIGVLTREFVVFAAPVLAAGDLVNGAFRRRETWRRWLLAAVAFVVVLDGVQALRPFADLRGPGTRGEVMDAVRDQWTNLTDRLRIAPSRWPARSAAFATRSWPALIVGEDIAGRGAVPARAWVAAFVSLVLLAGVARLTWIGWPRASAGFAWYLAGLGLVASAAFVVTRPVENAPLRYVLLALYLPVGLTALWLSAEPRRMVRGVVLAVIVVWAAASAAAHIQYAAPFVSGAERDVIGDLAAALEARGVTVARAEYWRAYRITFRTRERVIVASTDYVRIEEYQERAGAAGPAVPRLQEGACEDGEPLVDGWYLCPR